MVYSVSSEQFFTLTEGMAWVSHTQTRAWCEAFIPERERCFFVDDLHHPQIACVGQFRCKWGLRMLFIAGECLHLNPMSDKTVHTFYEGILAQQPVDLCYINSDSIYHPLFETGIRQAGYLRPVGLFSTTLSKIVRTDQPLSMDKSWRRNLKHAEACQLDFVVEEYPFISDIQAYQDAHRAMEQRKRFSDSLIREQQIRLLADNRFRLAWVNTSEGEHVAGGIIYCREQEDGYARFLYSFTTEKGRKLSAAYKLYESLVRYLREHAVKRFDLGRISPSKHSKNNIFLFKNGLGGTTISYNGEWLWTRYRWLPLLFYFANRYRFKRVQV